MNGPYKEEKLDEAVFILPEPDHCRFPVGECADQNLRVE
jgi:hypothetical protein